MLCQQCFHHIFLSHRGLHSDKLELEANRSGYSLDPALTYTALITSQLGQGVTRSVYLLLEVPFLNQIESGQTN